MAEKKALLLERTFLFQYFSVEASAVRMASNQGEVAPVSNLSYLPNWQCVSFVISVKSITNNVKHTNLIPM